MNRNTVTPLNTDTHTATSHLSPTSLPPLSALSPTSLCPLCPLCSKRWICMTHNDIFNLREETEVHMKIMAGGYLTINSQGYMNRVRVSGGYAQVRTTVVLYILFHIITIFEVLGSARVHCNMNTNIGHIQILYLFLPSSSSFFFLLLPLNYEHGRRCGSLLNHFEGGREGRRPSALSPRPLLPLPPLTRP